MPSAGKGCSRIGEFRRALPRRVDAVHNEIGAGFGEAIARRFSKDGWRLILLGRRADRLDKLAKELGTPISYVGTGEKAADLAEFRPDTYVDSLFFGEGEGF